MASLMNFDDWLSASNGGLSPDNQNRSPASDAPAPERLTPAQQMLRKKGIESSTVDPNTAALLRQLFALQQDDVNAQKKIADDYQNRPRKMNLAPLAGLVDAWTGSNFSKTIPAAETDDERTMNLAKLRQLASQGQQGLLKDQISLMNAGNKDDTSMARILAMVANSGAAGDLKRMMATNKMRQDFGNALNSYKQSRNQIGVIAGTEVRASRLATLLDRYNNGDKLTPIEMREVSTGLAGLVSNQNITPVEQVNALNPKAANMTLAQLEQFFTNTPEEANLAGFAKRYAGTAKREAETADMQLKDIRRRQLGQHRTLWDTDQQNMISQAKDWGITPEEMYDSFAPIDVKLKKEAASGKKYKEMPFAENPTGVYSQAPSLDEPPVGGAGLAPTAPKTVVKMQHNVPGPNGAPKTKVIYSDGTSEVKDGHL